MAFKDVWNQKTWEKQSKIFAVKVDNEITGEEVPSEVFFESLSVLNSVKDSGNIEKLQEAIIDVTRNFVLCKSLLSDSVNKFNFSDFILFLLQNPQNEVIKHAVLTIIISWMDKWPESVEFITALPAVDYITQLLFSETNDERSQILTLNLLSRIILVSEEVKQHLLEECQVIKPLVDAFFSCDSEKIRDLVLLCLWSILHTKPHPSFQQVSDVTRLFNDMFSEPDPQNFEKRLYIASVFAECDDNCAFIMCDIFPVAEALENFFDLSNENKESLLNLLIALLDSNDTCSSMTVIGSISWSFFQGISEDVEELPEKDQEELDEVRIAATRLLCAIFKNEECPQEMILTAIESGVFDVLFNWANIKTYQLRRWSMIAIMQAVIRNLTKEVMEYFMGEKCLFSCMSEYLEMNSMIVTREVFLAIQALSNLLTIEIPELASTMESLEIPELATSALESIEKAEKLDCISDIIEEIQDKLNEFQNEI